MQVIEKCSIRLSIRRSVCLMLHLMHNLFCLAFLLLFKITGSCVRSGMKRKFEKNTF